MNGQRGNIVQLEAGEKGIAVRITHVRAQRCHTMPTGLYRSRITSIRMPLSCSLFNSPSVRKVFYVGQRYVLYSLYEAVVHLHPFLFLGHLRGHDTDTPDCKGHTANSECYAPYDLVHTSRLTDVAHDAHGAPFSLNFFTAKCSAEVALSGRTYI